MKININSILRYLSVGVVHFICIYCFNIFNIQNNTDKFINLLFLLILLTFGALTYLVYRAFIYNKFIVALQDKINKNNYRNYLMKQYEISRQQAILLYVIIRDLGKINLKKETKLLFVNCHLGYITSILMFFYSIISILFHYIITEDFFIFILLSILIFLASLKFDERLENEETNLLKMVDKKEINYIFLKVIKNKLMDKENDSKFEKIKKRRFIMYSDFNEEVKYLLSLLKEIDDVKNYDDFNDIIESIKKELSHDEIVVTGH